MLEMIPDMPDGTIGIEAVGEIRAADYRDMLMPLLDKTLAEHPKLRVVILLGPRYEGFKASALWDDVKLGVSHFTKWERCGVVTDIDWVRHAVPLFGWTIPGKVKVFGVAELDAAKKWVSE